MKLHSLDVAIIATYFLATILIGLWVSRRGAKDLDSYFLGGKSLPWYLLGISDASGMFDISGTMLMVYWLLVYGVKSIWLPFLWPVFNQIFLMMFLSGWLRRSNVLTGAEWIQTRFGRGTGANLAHISVVIFAVIQVIGMLAYAFKGIGKFAVVILPWRFTGATEGLLSDENIYAIIMLSLTSLYAIKGGMVSVVITEVMQFTILTATSIIIGFIAIYKVSPEMVQAAVPAGWLSPFFGWKLGLDWTGILDKANDAIRQDGNEFFTIIFGLMFFKGVLASLAGPLPNYDMQRVLATRNPREACMMNGFVNVVLYFPRYMMITGLTILGLAFCMPQMRAMPKPDFEKLLPIVLTQYVPAGVVGLLLAGLLAAFMSNFAATINAAPAYLVNDIYKRYINPHAPARTYVILSYAASFGVVIVGLMFGPVADSLERRGISPALSAGIVVVMLIVLIVGSILSFAVPLSEWVARAPLIWEKFRVTLMSLKEPLDGKSKFVTTRVDPDISKELDAAGVTYAGRLESNFLAMLLSWILPVLFFFGVWMFLAKRMQGGPGGPGGGLMAIGKSKAKVYVETDTRTSFADVAGVDEAKAELAEVVAFLASPASTYVSGAIVPVDGAFLGGL